MDAEGYYLTVVEISHLTEHLVTVVHVVKKGAVICSLQQNGRLLYLAWASPAPSKGYIFLASSLQVNGAFCFSEYILPRYRKKLQLAVLNLGKPKNRNFPFMWDLVNEYGPFESVVCIYSFVYVLLVEKSLFEQSMFVIIFRFSHPIPSVKYSDIISRIIILSIKGVMQIGVQGRQ